MFSGSFPYNQWRKLGVLFVFRFAFSVRLMLVPAFALMLVGCSTPPQSANAGVPSTGAENTSTTKVETFDNLPKLKGSATVVMETTKGTITIALDGDNAPVTAGNFADLVRRGFYNGLTFHRVEKDPQPFVIQGGDPKGNGTGGFIDPKTKTERTIPLEIKTAGDTQPVYNTEIAPSTPAKKLVLPHSRGAIAMARSAPLGSASSQFYFTLAPIDFLDGHYAVFGKIVKGEEVIDKIVVGDKITKATLSKGAENIQQPK
jgi:peptidyl-prolyl cis-trans isomerase B (cyclophilin B)